MRKRFLGKEVFDLPDLSNTVTSGLIDLENVWIVVDLCVPQL